MKIEFCAIEGGSFRMGTDLEAIEIHTKMFAYALGEWTREMTDSWFRKHVPSREVAVHHFEMSRSLITRAQFGEFETAVFGSSSALSAGDEDLPVEGVSYYGARQFCEWQTQRLGASISLPTEAEWEYAASSRGKYLFPWGDEFDPSRANTAEGAIGHSTPVDAFLNGASEQGIVDLAGNLEEWTDSFYLPYPGGTFIHDHISEENGATYPILRGGCYRHHGDLCLAFRRHGYRENYTPMGFRVVRRSNSARLQNPIARVIS